MARYASDTLAGLKRALLDAIPESTTVGIRPEPCRALPVLSRARTGTRRPAEPCRDVDQSLAGIQGAVVTVCSNVVAGLRDEWEGCYMEALASDEAPFKLQRFPQFVTRLMEFCSCLAPRVAKEVVQNLSQLVEAVIASSSHAVELELSKTLKQIQQQ